MYTKTLLFILAFLPCTVFAQSYFEKKDFLSAQQQAKSENKLLFVQVPSEDCDRCNQVAQTAFKDKELSKFIQANCVAVTIDADSPEWNLVSSTHGLLMTYGTVVFSPEGNVLKVYEGSTTLTTRYIDLINASKKNAKDDAYETLLQEYNRDTLNHQLLYTIIQRRSAAGLASDSLLDRLTVTVPRDSLHSFSFIQFVIKQYPYVGAKATFMVHKDDDYFKQAWYRMSQMERVTINGRINARSMAKAIRNKDLPYARIVATNHMRTTTNVETGRRIYMEDVLLYYRGVKDTSNYITIGKSYVDQYIMPIAVDSVRKRDSLLTIAALKSIRKVDTINYTKDSIRIQTSIQTSTAATQYSSRLNDIAWQIYCSKEDDYYLTKALEYAKRATELNNFTPALMDTYARLLYKTGNRNDAIAWEEKAVDLAAKQQPALPTTYKKVVKKMKANEDVTAKD